ncbi:tyrosine-type recombinase/integrase, partial [Nocardia sp. NPDC058497]|uniref:tyrosine-type recombinase/integrase n=1 Tax=Nocardia sp. NPDC058497 TaxID=3346529 RepID=UPI0036534E48
MAEFVLVPRVRLRQMEPGKCVVSLCERPWQVSTVGLCSAHSFQQKHSLKLPLEEFLVHPKVVGLASLGACSVLACTRDRITGGPYCRSHGLRWAADRRMGRFTAADEPHWRLTQPAVARGGEVSLRGLPDRVVFEILFGLQQRVRAAIKTQPNAVRRLADHVRFKQLDTVEAVDPADLSVSARQVCKWVVDSSKLLRSSPETERHKDEWNTAVFGHRGRIWFHEISQPWLKEAVKAWAANELPQRRGPSSTNHVRELVKTMVLLSESLRIQRCDHGLDPTMLSRNDITSFLNRLAFLHAEGTISYSSRLNAVYRAGQVLAGLRSTGQTRPDAPAHGLADDFVIVAGDTPDNPEEDDVGRALPDEVMRQLCSYLPELEVQSYPEIRVAVELIIDTGRRPAEITELMLDCLDKDADGKPVIVYNDYKANREGRRLPIHGATAALIQRQQTRTRERFPHTPPGELKLLPAPKQNPHGRRALDHKGITKRHREWVDAMPEILIPLTVTIDGTPVTKLLPFDKTRIFPYAYRHTYAQRHADAGVPVDVLRELMQHRQIDTTQTYYRIGEKRRREAVEQVTAMQFDRHGNRVWREVKALLDSEHLRRAVGEVAVPYGTCSEPSNVAAGGQDCPVRFRCVGCSHFSTDVSYLPDLEAYLADLLR